MPCNVCKRSLNDIPEHPDNEGFRGIFKNPYLSNPDPENGSLYGVLNPPSHHIPEQLENEGTHDIARNMLHENPKEHKKGSLQSILEKISHQVPGQSKSGSTCSNCTKREPHHFEEQRENEIPFAASHLSRQHHAFPGQSDELGLASQVDVNDDENKKPSGYINPTVPTAPLPMEPPIPLGPPPASMMPYPTDPSRFAYDEAHDFNRYATKKTIAQGLIDLSLLAANVAQLKHLLTSEDAKWKSGRLALVITLLTLQILQTIVLVVLGAVFNMNRRLDQKRAERLNNVSLCLMFAIVVMSGISTGLDSRF